MSRLESVPASEGAEIIEIADIGRTERLGIKPDDYTGCRHNRTLIDERLRVVDCRVCGARLDPIEVLLDIAKHWRSESWQARQIAEFQRKEYDKTTEREKRFVRQHVVCHGCGLQTRLTAGSLSSADWEAWAAHWGTEPEHPYSWDATKIHPKVEHRRRTEADIEANRRPIAPVPMTGSAIYRDRAPHPEDNTPRRAAA